MDDLFKAYGLKTLNVKIVQNWMQKLGFKHEVRKNVYYVNMHESREKVEYRSTYIDTYFEYELQAHRWHSITEKKERNID